MKKQTAFAGVLAALLLLGGCGKQVQNTSAENGTAVEVQTVSRAQVAAQNQLSGKVTPRDEVSVLPPIAAKVLSVQVKTGQHVTKGQLLFSVDPSDITKNIPPIQGERSRTAALYDTQIASARKTLADTKTLTATQTRQAQQTADNTRALYHAGAASSIDAEKADDALTQAKLNAQQSIQQAQLAVEQLMTTKANAVATYDKNISDLQKSVSDTRVTATASGTVIAVDVVQGGMASPQSAAVTLALDGASQVLVSVSEDVQPFLKVGDTVPVIISAIGSQTVSTRIASIAPTADAKTQLYDVHLNLPADSKAAYGMLATVQFTTNRHANAVMIPNDSILTDEKGQYVYIVRNKKAVYVSVKTGLVGTSATEITSGLSGGEQLVTKGQSYLSEGADVRIVNGTGQSSGSAEAAT